MYHVPLHTCGRGSVLLRRQYNTSGISGFVDDVMLSHNGSNGSESKATRMLHSVRQVAAPGRSLPPPTASCTFIIALCIIYSSTFKLS